MKSRILSRFPSYPLLLLSILPSWLCLFSHDDKDWSIKVQKNFSFYLPFCNYYDGSHPFKSVLFQQGDGPSLTNFGIIAHISFELTTKEDTNDAIRKEHLHFRIRFSMQYYMSSVPCVGSMCFITYGEEEDCGNR